MRSISLTWNCLFDFIRVPSGTQRGQMDFSFQVALIGKIHWREIQSGRGRVFILPFIIDFVFHNVVQYNPIQVLCLIELARYEEVCWIEKMKTKMLQATSPMNYGDRYKITVKQHHIIDKYN